MTEPGRIEFMEDARIDKITLYNIFKRLDQDLQISK